MRLGVDAMGGDYAPEVVVAGAIEASAKVSSSSVIVLFGDKSLIDAMLQEKGFAGSNIEVVNATEVIEMGDHPTQAFAKKPDSSIAVGFKWLGEGKIDGFASAGSTGAMLVGAMYTVKQIEGVIRPTIATAVPTANGGKVVLLDVGLNVDCKPEVLVQYGILGSIFSKEVVGNDNPRVALLNIGEEKEKGNIQTKATYSLMEESGKFNFVGNIEAKHIFTGEIADVVVCDGFVGNTILKQAEGIYSILSKDGITSPVTEGFNYENAGGTPILGVNKCVIIGHGCSSAKAITNMILQTENAVKAQLVTKIKEAFC